MPPEIYTKIFPTIGMIINGGAVILCLIGKDIPRAAYWLFALLLTYTVTYWMQ